MSERRTEWFDDRYWDKGITHLAGVDEAGRGPLAGPVVAAAVILPPRTDIAGLNDSKQMRPLKRELVYTIIQEVAVGIGVGIVYEEEIEEINILQAALLAMKEAAKNLPHRAQFILVDGNRTPEWEWESIALVKGDSLSHSVAAASVIAKVTRDRMMMELDSKYPEYEFCRHKGYGTKRHIEAIRKYGLSPVHRRSFCRKILKSGK